MAKGRSIQNISGIFHCDVLPKEHQVISVGVDSRKNGVMWKAALKRLPELLGPLDFFVGNCKKILPWVTPYEIFSLALCIMLLQQKIYMVPYPSQNLRVFHTKTCNRHWVRYSRSQSLGPRRMCLADIVGPANGEGDPF